MHVVSENHFYKSEVFYTVVRNEMSGKNTVPSSGQVIEAYVVPIRLEKAKLSGIEVSDWEISYQYASMPCVIYGLNYFSTPAEFFVVKDEDGSQGRHQACHQQRKVPLLLPEVGRRRQDSSGHLGVRECGGERRPSGHWHDKGSLSTFQDPAVQRGIDRARWKVFTLFIGAGEVFKAHQAGEASPRRVPAEQMGPVHRRRNPKCLT